MSEFFGVSAAIVGSMIGGSAVVATRYGLAFVDPVGIAALRYGIGALCLAPFALRLLRSIRELHDLLTITGLSILFFAVYPYLFTLSLQYTTAARGALALSTMPLLTLAFALLLGREEFSWRRIVGMLIAFSGLAYSMSGKLDGGVSSAWLGDLIMVAAAAVQGICNVLSRSFIQRFGAIQFTAFGLLVGAIILVAFSLGSGLLLALPQFDIATWIAILYLGIFGCAVLWIAWSVGLRYAKSSSVALTVLVNVLTASFLGAHMLSEPIGHQFIVGLLAVLFGIVFQSK